ncbi:MAG: class I SAM-dependent methyltransferase [Adlercreutzia equolifaciens]
MGRGRPGHPYADASYDVITMAYGIRNMPDRPRALSEMFRVLKPGGSLVCLEFSAAQRRVAGAVPLLPAPPHPVWGGLLTGDKDGFVYLAKSIRAFPDQEGLAEMREAGFTDVTWKNYTGGIAAVRGEEAGLGWPGAMFGFVVANAGALSEAEKNRYRAVYWAVPRAARPVRAAVAGVPDLRPHLLRAAVQLPA